VSDPREAEVQVDVLGESIVVAAAMRDPEARASLVRRIKSDRFQHRQHQVAWQAIEEVQRRRLEWDPQTAKGLFPELDVAYAEQLALGGPPRNLEHAVESLLWDSARAECTRGPLNALLGALKDRSTPHERVKALARQVAEALGEHRDRRYLRDSSAVVTEMLDELEARRRGEAVYPYGIEALDVDERTGKSRLAPGAKPGMLTVLTAVSGGGKSTMAARIALGQAMRGRRVLYGAWEMGDRISLELLAIMFLALKGYAVSRTRFLHGEHSDEEQELVGKAAAVVGRHVRFMQNPFGRQQKERSSNAANLDLIHQYVADTGADVMVCDLWDRCLVDQRPEEEKRALERTQAIAQETQSHLILLAQQRLKDIETRDDPHPTREGIKGSSSWTDVGDTQLGIHRPSQFKEIPDDVLEVDVLKRRYGPYPQRVEVSYDPDKGWYGQGTTVPFVRAARQEGPSGEIGDFLDADGNVSQPPAGRKGKSKR
jgi:replicative DNA helicase